MSVFAIIGAGPGLGAATARRFAREGLSIALIPRTPDKLNALHEELAADGVQVRGYSADVQHGDQLHAALTSAATDLGPIEVLQYSPVPRPEFLKPVLETTPTDLADAARFSIVGSATAVEAVLPGMKQLGQGTILLVNGSSAARPNGNVAGTSTAFAGESAYGAMLHDALAPKGIHVAQLIIPGAIGGGDPLYDPAALADQLWNLHASKGPFRITVGEGAA